MIKKSVRRKLNRVLALLMAIMVGVSAPLAAMATEAVKTSNYVISKVDTAKAELEKLAKSRSIAAAVYLKDVYTVKSDPSHYSEDVVSVASGQSVSIVSVGIDEGRNIWYKIQYNSAGTVLTGYVEREFLVSSDSRFLSWEDKYITTKNREEIRDNSDCSDIEAFPESYRDALYELRKTHPNWRFVRQDVGLDWNTVIAQETSGERSLISSSADSSFKEKASAGTAGWYIATKGIVSYYIDPRNFLAQDSIFMFEQETYNSNTHTTATVAKVLNGTFMSGGIPGTNASYAETFVSIGSKLNMSPIALASRVKQEQGVQGTSALISGTYSGYEGYYNYFNVNANGSTTKAVIESGLKYAVSKGWNTRVKSLDGGSAIVAKNYVGRGQDTLYLQKFDVDASDNSLYSHQYMQNIAAPYSEALSTYKAYNNAGLLDTPFVFKIPVYDNMPKGRCNKPNASDQISLNVTEVENLPVDQNAVLVTLINGGQNDDVPMTFSSSDSKVATVDDNGVVTGIKPGTATISVKRTENPTNTASCRVTVIKADVTLSNVEIPQISITYDAAQTLSKISLPAGFSWVDEKLVPAVSNEGYSVLYSPDNSKYNAVTMTIPVEVKKAVIDSTSVAVPTNLTIDAGAELSTVTLPDGFVWKDATQTAPKKTGKVSFNATYCVDPSCYEVLEVEVSLKVVCKTHEYGEWEGNHADCINDGKLVRKCAICGNEETLEEKATGHSYSCEVTKEATAKEAGIRTYTCEYCNDTYTEDIPKLVEKHEHKYAAKKTLAASCLTTGVMTYACSCGDSYTETIEALGHDYDDNHVCKRCKYELPVVPVHVHDYTLSECTATCTENGLNIYTCGCGESYSETAKKTGHTLKNGVCTKCGYGKAEATPTVEPTKEVEATPTPTVVPTKVVEATPTPTAVPTKEVEATPTPTVVPTKVVEATPTPTVVPTKVVEATPTPTPTKEAQPTKVAEVTLTPIAEPTKVEEASTTPTVAPTKAAVAATPTVAPTKAATPTKIVEATPTAAPTKDAAATPAPTTVPTKAAEETATAHASEPTKAADSSKSETVVAQIEPVDEFAEGDKPISVVMMSTTVLNKDKIEEYISPDNKRLEITMANDVVWDIDLTDVADYSQINVNLAVEFDKAEIPQEAIASVVDGNDYRVLELKHNGLFGFPVTMKLPVDSKFIGKRANLFYFNPLTNSLEYETDCIVDENSVAAYRMKHASCYAMIYSDISMDPAILAAIDNSGTKESEQNTADGGIVAVAENESTFGNNIIIYGIIAIAVILIISLVTGIVLKNRNDEYYYDDEDE